MLKSEYPQGVDVVYESVGGDMFTACFDALAPRGRIIIIGMMGEDHCISLYLLRWFSIF